MKRNKKTILTSLFILLYLAVGLVSCYHAINFFSVANQQWLAIILAIAFEIGQAVILFALLSDKKQSKKVMPWILMSILTLVQIMGNIVASYSYIMQHSPHDIKYFVDSIMFFVSDPNPQINTVILSYIIGAILPIVALCMTGMIVGVSEINEPEKKKEKETIDTSKIFL